MLTIPRDKWTVVECADGSHTALVECPKCNRPGSTGGHKISSLGVVAPSLGCGHDDCDFRDDVTLAGWETYEATP